MIFLMGDGRPLFIYIMLRADRCSVLILNPINSAKKIFQHFSCCFVYLSFIIIIFDRFFFQMIFFCIFVFVMLIIGDEKPPVTLVNIFLDLLFKRPQLLSLLVGISSILICINSPRAGGEARGQKITCVSSFSKWICRFRLLMCGMLDAFMQINCRCVF